MFVSEILLSFNKGLDFKKENSQRRCAVSLLPCYGGNFNIKILTFFPRTVLLVTEVQMGR